MELALAVAKIGKYATSESGDTFEMIERPQGGLSFVLVDGQHSGRGAKSVSNLVARKAVSDLAEGVRDGAVARAAHDYLFAYRQGKVSATLNIVSVDLVTRTIVLARNNHCPTLVVARHAGRAGLRALDQPSNPVGIYARTKPNMTEMPLEAETAIVVYTDGIMSAGELLGQPIDVPALVQEATAYGTLDARRIADALLSAALEADDGRPQDDMSVVVLTVTDEEPHSGTRDGVRRLLVRSPL
jgi:serine phosphatase RsbU (regulator of sigma subunit)